MTTAVNTAQIRQHNLARVFHALRRRPGSSQRELGEVTGLDKATVSAIVRQLETAGLLRRRPQPSRGRVGRPEVALYLDEAAGVLVGVRLEPNTIRLLATTLAGEVVGRGQLASSLEPETALQRLERGIGELLAELALPREKLLGLGVGVPALVDAVGRVVFAPNFGWREVPLHDMLARRFALPVFLDNDSNAAALAEQLFGCAWQVDDFVFIAGHSGLGGALVRSGEVYRGVGGYAGEVGHMRVVPGGRRCSCGGHGCLEAYLSEASLLRRLAERGLRLPDLAAVSLAAAGGEPRVLALLEESAGLLAQVLGNLVLLLNPSLIVLGGNLALVADSLLPEVRAQLARLSPSAPARQVEVAVSAFGAEAVPMGGVALALEGFLERQRHGAVAAAV